LAGLDKLLKGLSASGNSAAKLILHQPPPQMPSLLGMNKPEVKLSDATNGTGAELTTGTNEAGTQKSETKLSDITNEAEPNHDSTEIVKRSLESEESGANPKRSKTVSASRKAGKRLCRARKRKKDRANEFETVISDQSRSLGSQFLARKIAIERENKSKEAKHDHSDKDTQKTANLHPVPRAPTEEEQADAAKQVKDWFRPTIGVARGLPHNIVLKQSKAKERPRLPLRILPQLQAVYNLTYCSGLSLVMISRHHSTGILDRYRNEKAIETNQDLYSKFMEDSEKAGSILWDTFYTFGNVAADKTRQHMKKLAESGLGSSLAFPSNEFFNDHQPDEDRESDPPLSFAIVIPTFDSTGKIASESEGHRVDNGEFVFPDIKQAIQFPSDNICVMIFRAQQHAHGTLPATEFEDSTKLMICIQPPNLQDNRTRKNNPHETRDEQNSTLEN
ncbi:hypothetical protein PSHT_10563, partial [Puccinia striiformis]